MENIQELLAGTIDYKGQELADFYSKLILTFGSLISCILGFILQNLKITLISFVISIILTLIVVIPPYPFYNKNNLKFLPSVKNLKTTTTNIVIEN
ncbi:unnamed protein product [[Candida] boidinii]|uniref:Signal peptidase complex subunit 1 n=1 Tax=Candida boidinii TaxID=5477 RepID=A0A9W6T573_CANBO|nr:hypothetical protein B5S30_g926 [[Candida] boidinii]OWB84572.1 hypothetical protein B5S33_g3221 [[Candida] boidinii]GME73083.1 unnamed protein product [[Candida] boidinii]GME98624.1 unnamed protein product [[Candida] boidinii]GMF98661.1 unnamed protein product [[Candida] boidinii]